APGGPRGSAGTAGQPAERHQNEGHGRRLTMAFEALEAFPALAESRDRLLTVVSKDHVATADVVSAVESDVALIIAVLRMANQAQAGRGRIDTVVGAVELLKPQTVQTLAARLRTFDFFERSSVWEGALERRWGLPPSIATTIERHHNTEVEGEAAFIRLADMLAHYEQGAAVSPAELLQTARTVGLGPSELRQVMYELPSAPNQRRRH